MLTGTLGKIITEIQFKYFNSTYIIILSKSSQIYDFFPKIGRDPEQTKIFTENVVGLIEFIHNTPKSQVAIIFRLVPVLDIVIQANVRPNKDLVDKPVS